MSKPPRSEAEKALLIGAIQRRYARGDASMRAAAAEFGVNESTYYAWVKAGIKAPAVAPVRRTTSERRQLVDDVTAAITAGKTVTAACAAVGISDKAFRAWRDEFRPPPLREVNVTTMVPSVSAVTFAPLPAQPLTLQAPGGYRVEGLDADTLVALLRKLSC